MEASDGAVAAFRAGLASDRMREEGGRGRTPRLAARFSLPRPAVPRLWWRCSRLSPMLGAAASLDGDLLGERLEGGAAAPPLKAVRISGTVLITKPPVPRMLAPAPAPPVLVTSAAPLPVISSWDSTGE